jgi:ParB/RepB/Spo0J family partition protein
MPRPAPKPSQLKKDRKSAPKVSSSRVMENSTPEPTPPITTTEPAPAIEKRRGRPPGKSKVPVDVPTVLDDDLVVRKIPLGEIDLGDVTYRFRAVVRVADLVKSIRESGQQIPAVVRPHPQPDDGFKWQLVSGFRRATALTELKADFISAYVRRDLVDDQEAFRASVLENMARKTYSDIDRAYVIKRYQDSGYKSFEVAELMNLTKRQKNNLLALLDLPAEVQTAIGEEGTTFKATHALTLKKLKAKYPKLHYIEWVTRINNEELSIPQIVRHVNEAFRGASEKKSLPSIFRTDGTNLKIGDVRLRPVKFNAKELSDAEKKALRSELEGVLALLS